MGTTIYSPLQKTTKKQSQHWRLNSQKNKKSYNLFISIFLIPQFDLSLCIKAIFFGGGVEFLISLHFPSVWGGSVGFQTEITPFQPIDGVGHQSLSLGKTLNVLSLSLLFESPRCQDLLVWSSFSFQEVFYHSPRVPLFLYPQRGSGTFVFHHYVKCILSFFMFCGMFSPQIHLSSKVDSRVSL